MRISGVISKITIVNIIARKFIFNFCGNFGGDFKNYQGISGVISKFTRKFWG